jgi:hypothetical protein
METLFHYVKKKESSRYSLGTETEYPAIAQENACRNPTTNHPSPTRYRAEWLNDLTSQIRRKRISMT